jgi:rhodanese-related sulfurtransferase
MVFSNISPRELHEQMQAGESVDLIDVRTPQEYKAGHVRCARLLPLDRLTKEAVLAERQPSPERPLYVICQSGGRSRTACARLVEQGLTNVVNVEGGTAAWRQAGLPVEAAAPTGSANLLRTAGILCMVVSLILGVTVHPGFTFAGALVWLGMVLTGNAPCCSGGSCSIRREA